MAIQVTCLSCGARFAVDDKYAGKEGPCPKCKTMIRVPAATTKSATTTRRRSSASGGTPAAGGTTPEPPATRSSSTATPRTSSSSRRPTPAPKAESESPAARAAAREAGGASLEQYKRRPTTTTTTTEAARTEPTEDDDVVIHAPDRDDVAVSSGQAKKGGKRIAAKPIAREDMEFNTTYAVFIGVGVLVVFAAAYFIGQSLQPPTLPWVVWGMTVAIALPMSWGAYWVLSDPEMDRHEGRDLWMRALICTAVYGAIWIVWLLVPTEYRETLLNVALLAAPSIIIGIIAAFATLDLEWENAFLHFLLFAGVSLLLRATAGLPWV